MRASTFRKATQRQDIRPGARVTSVSVDANKEAKDRAALLSSFEQERDGRRTNTARARSVGPAEGRRGNGMDVDRAKTLGLKRASLYRPASPSPERSHSPPPATRPRSSSRAASAYSGRRSDAESSYFGRRRRNSSRYSSDEYSSDRSPSPPPVRRAAPSAAKIAADRIRNQPVKPTNIERSRTSTPPAPARVATPKSQLSRETTTPASPKQPAGTHDDKAPPAAAASGWMGSLWAKTASVWTAAPSDEAAEPPTADEANKKPEEASKAESPHEAKPSEEKPSSIAINPALYTSTKAEQAAKKRAEEEAAKLAAEKEKEKPEEPYVEPITWHRPPPVHPREWTSAQTSSANLTSLPFGASKTPFDWLTPAYISPLQFYLFHKADTGAGRGRGRGRTIRGRGGRPPMPLTRTDPGPRAAPDVPRFALTDGPQPASIPPNAFPAYAGMPIAPPVAPNVPQAYHRQQYANVVAPPPIPPALSPPPFPPFPQHQTVPYSPPVPGVSIPYQPFQALHANLGPGIPPQMPSAFPAPPPFSPPIPPSFSQQSSAPPPATSLAPVNAVMSGPPSGPAWAAPGPPTFNLPPTVSQPPPFSFPAQASPILAPNPPAWTPPQPNLQHQVTSPPISVSPNAVSPTVANRSLHALAPMMVTPLAAPTSQAGLAPSIPGNGPTLGTGPQATPSDFSISPRAAVAPGQSGMTAATAAAQVLAEMALPPMASPHIATSEHAHVPSPTLPPPHTANAQERTPMPMYSAEKSLPPPPRTSSLDAGGMSSSGLPVVSSLPLREDIVTSAAAPRSASEIPSESLAHQEAEEEDDEEEEEELDDGPPMIDLPLQIELGWTLPDIGAGLGLGETVTGASDFFASLGGASTAGQLDKQDDGLLSFPDVDEDFEEEESGADEDLIEQAFDATTDFVRTFKESDVIVSQNSGADAGHAGRMNRWLEQQGVTPAPIASLASPGTPKSSTSDDTRSLELNTGQSLGSDLLGPGGHRPRTAPPSTLPPSEASLASQTPSMMLRSLIRPSASQPSAVLPHSQIHRVFHSRSQSAQPSSITETPPSPTNAEFDSESVLTRSRAVTVNEKSVVFGGSIVTPAIEKEEATDLSPRKPAPGARPTSGPPKLESPMEAQKRRDKALAALSDSAFSSRSAGTHNLTKAVEVTKKEEAKSVSSEMESLFAGW